MQSHIDIVVKIGGGVLICPDQFSNVLATVANAARNARVLIVPGGGPFADAVRDVDRRIRLSDDAAHWMAVLGMNQYAYLIASRLDGAVLAENPDEIGAACAAGRVPVLAPYRWLRAADPLPHSWDVTSDSIAAWVAGVTGARRLLLVKPPGVSRLEDGTVDAYFSRALPRNVRSVIVAADRLDMQELSTIECQVSSKSFKPPCT